MINKLLTREEFNKKVFQRDNFRCIICNAKGIDAHHILDRSLFEDGGYYIDNGVTVCAKCHLEAEQGILTPEELREAADIKNIILPEGFNPRVSIDKWGKPVRYFKYPRTYHLTYSPSCINDDKMLQSDDCFNNKQVVVSIKMDGENTSLYNDYIHARSLNATHHASRNWIKAFHGMIQNDIPEGWRVCGENLFARHSISYDNLLSYFYGFSIWDERNFCRSWNETKQLFRDWSITPVEIFYEGVYDKAAILKAWEPLSMNEGFVVRVVNPFHYSNFDKNCAKYVSNKFRRSLDESTFWRNKPVVPNGLK